MQTYRDYYRYIIDHVSLTEVFSRLDMRTQGRGKQLSVLCPFHNDKRPSLHIYKDHYHCYACGAHGDLFSLIRKVKNCSFQDALLWVEQQFPFVLGQKPVRPKEKSRPEQTAYQIAYHYYAAQSVDIVREAAVQRGYELDFLQAAEVYDTDGSTLSESASREEQDALVEKQLLQRKVSVDPAMCGSYQDYFLTRRLLFTLRDYEHQIVGFAGRSLSTSDKPKYLFTRELPKDKLLYRLNVVHSHWTHADADGEVCTLYLVEGLFDALRLESLGKSAAAVLGSRLTKGQLHLLERFVTEQQHLNRTVALVCFLDSDGAGIRGAFHFLESVWRSDILRRSPLSIILDTQQIRSQEGKGKDPDELLNKLSPEQAAKWLAEHQLHPMEFLLRYLLDDQKLLFGGDTSLEGYLGDLSFPQKIQVFNRASNLFSEAAWDELLSFYQADTDTQSGRTALGQFERYLRNWPQPSEGVPDTLAAETGAEAPYLLALELARVGYRQEAIPLDSDSWERLHAGIDLLSRYYEGLRSEAGRSLLRTGCPMLAFYMPKDPEQDRLKALPNHEDLILQQYLLNELLREEDYAGYARNIPAVRYDPLAGGVYTTGLGYMDTFKDTPYRAVSFAYQVDMPVLRQNRRPINGVFRHYYDCWKDFIEFLRDGIDRMDTEKLYRVKLDIRGYYDNIQRYTLRNVLTPAFAEAFGYTQTRFVWLKEDGRQKQAEAVVDVLLEGLFQWEYVDPHTGETKQAEDPLKGIPQGPALSAYVANVLLFPLDRAVSQYVNQINAELQDGVIRVRYARYVDDMVILAADPVILADIERIIHEQLYAIGLELSPKTDHPDSVEKDEARWWLVDQRGGLGVSASSLAPEDTLDELWGSGFEPYVVDRHDALNILKGTTDILDTASPDRFWEAFVACFKTESIRYRDASRLAAFALEYLLTRAEKPAFGKLYSAFQDLWQTGIEQMRDLRSILSRTDVTPLVFFEGLLLLIERNISSSLPVEDQNAQRQLKQSATRHIADWTALKQAKEVYSAAPQSKNHAFLPLKLIQLGVASLAHLTEVTDREDLLRRCWETAQRDICPKGLSCYLERWQYALLTASGKPKDGYATLSSDDFPKDETNDLQLFHFLTTRLALCETEDQFRDLGSLFLTHRTIQTDRVGIHTVERLWFLKDTDDQAEPKLAEVALRTLSNFLHKDYLPSIVSQNPALQGALFPKNTADLRYLPVPPAVNYPGIFAVNTAQSMAYRADFSNTAEPRKESSPPILDWKPAENCPAQVWHIYQASLPDNPWFQLGSPLPAPGEEVLPPELVGQVTELYRKLCSLFQKSAGGYAVPGLMASKYHIFRNGAGQLYAMTYRRSPWQGHAGVALAGSGQSRVLKWHILEDGPGMAERAAALLLEDLLELNLYPVEMGTADVLEVLRYALGRLTGRRMQAHLHKLREASFTQTIQRTLETMERFAASPPEQGKIILLEVALTDRLMHDRLNWRNPEFYPGEGAAFLCRWAAAAVRQELPRLNDALEGKIPTPAVFELRRTTAAWRNLGHRLAKLNETTDSAIHALNAAALMTAVCGDIRARVLEYVWSLDEGELLHLQTIPLPLDRLKTQDKDSLVLLLTGDEPPEKQGERLRKAIKIYRSGRGSMQLEEITPLGWLLLLAWILEPDPEGRLHPRLLQKGNSDGSKYELSSIWEFLSDMERLLLPEEHISEENFPYGGLTSILLRWTPETADGLLEQLYALDAQLGFQVCRKTSSNLFFGRGNRPSGQITLQLDPPVLVSYPIQFVTCFQDAGQMPQIEECCGQRVWTQTILGEKVLGISVVTQKIADLTSETASTQTPDRPAQKMEDMTEHKSTSQIQELEYGAQPPSQKEHAAKDSTALEQPPAAGETDAFAETSRCTDEVTFRKRLNKLQQAQLSRWQLRKSKDAGIDRIALFQFDVDDSYVHPLSECCLHQEELDTDKFKQIKQDPTRWNSSKVAEHGQKLYSCAEYRRRRLLTSVFSSCSTFDVDILLLPEYSVRPETVLWILETIKRFGYRFSVWAGTCRLTPGRSYTDENLQKLNGPSFDCSAVLPIISSQPAMDPAGDTELFLDRFKKYPSISMEEVINPIPQHELRPVMKTKGRLYGDARDDVMELICAEVFLSTNPGNLLAFSHIYDMLRMRFSGVPVERSRQRENILSDLFVMGEHTSLFHTKGSYQTLDGRWWHGVGKYGRTPILLVPAYTTRTVDYYISGQAGYLAAGLTMVFCNAVGQNTRGESCFIGTDCWEKENEETLAFMPDYSLYHGALPGIYRQFDTKQGHGALGKQEQALVICDINPAVASVSKPRPESMLYPLSLVAHLPVIESCTYRKRTKLADQTSCGPYDQCRCKRVKADRSAFQKDKKTDAVVSLLDTLYAIYDKWDRQGKKGKTMTTAYDAEPDRLADILEKLSRELDSPGLKERADHYRRFHKNNPQLWPPATLLDWIWVDIKFPEQSVRNCDIDVPVFTEQRPNIDQNSSV